MRFACFLKAAAKPQRTEKGAYRIAAAEPLRTEKESSGGTAAYREGKIFTKYKNYERVIEIMES